MSITSMAATLAPFADDPELAALLAASVQAHTAAAEASSSKAALNPFAGDEQLDHIGFGDDEEENVDEGDEEEDEEPETAEERIARERSGRDDWQRTAQASLNTHTAAKAQAAASTSNAQVIADAAFDTLDSGEAAAGTLSQRARKKLSKQTRAATAGDAWFGMPRLIPTSTTNAPSAKDAGLTPAERARAVTAGHKNAAVAADARSRTAAEIAREVQAIRLRNALDPKRFYRGARGDRALALPEFAQIGTILPDDHAPRQNLARSERSVNRGSVVEELLRDDTAKEYATRKFGELQDARGCWQAGKGEKRKGSADGKKSKKKQRK